MVKQSPFCGEPTPCLVRKITIAKNITLEQDWHNCGDKFNDLTFN